MNSIIDKIIISKNEEIKAILGKKNIDLNKNKPFIILTNRTVYFFGEHYRYYNGDVFGKTCYDEAIPIKDFIGAGQIHKRSRRKLYYLVFTGVSISILSQISKKLFKLGLDNNEFKIFIAVLGIAFIVLLYLQEQYHYAITI